MFANIIAPDTLSRRQARTQPTSTEGDKSKGGNRAWGVDEVG